MKNKNNRLLKLYNCENPFPLTLSAYDIRPQSEKRYLVVLAYNSAKHAWNHLISIWEMINEEMLNDSKSSIKLLNGELNIENHLKSIGTIKRLKYTQVHVTSFYIYARMFIDRSAAIYPILTSHSEMPKNNRDSFPRQYYWLKKNKSERDTLCFQIFEKHYDGLFTDVINPRNKLISHPVCITEQFMMGGGKAPKIGYEMFSLEDENYLIELLKKYGDLIEDKIKYPKQNVPVAIKILVEYADKLEHYDFKELMKIKDRMIDVLPSIEDTMENVDSFRLDLDKHYSSLIDEGILSSCDGNLSFA